MPLIVADHPSHEEVLSRVAGRKLGLAGHAAFETYSVLTRLPAPPRRGSPNAVSKLLDLNVPETRFLPAQAHLRLLRALADLGIAGGSGI